MYKLRDVTRTLLHSNVFISGVRKIVFMLFSNSVSWLILKEQIAEQCHIHVQRFGKKKLHRVVGPLRDIEMFTFTQ